MSNNFVNLEQTDLENSDWSDFAQSLEELHNCLKCNCSISLIDHNMKTLTCNHNYCTKCYEDDKFTFCTVCSMQVKKEKKIKPTIQQIKLPINPTMPSINPNQQFRPTINPTINPSRIPVPGINVYSFSLRPEDHQPSGSVNWSRIDNTRLIIDSATPIQGPINGLNSVMPQTPNTFLNNIPLNIQHNIRNTNNSIDLANQRMVSELRRLTGNDQLFSRDLYQRK